MENLIRNSAKTWGIFASGMIAGLVASLLSRKSEPFILRFRKQLGRTSLPKIVPTIPRFDEELRTIEVDSHLGFNE